MSHIKVKLLIYISVTATSSTLEDIGTLALALYERPLLSFFMSFAKHRFEVLAD